jgi:hypothetical protein
MASTGIKGSVLESKEGSYSSHNIFYGHLFSPKFCHAVFFRAGGDILQNFIKAQIFNQFFLNSHNVTIPVRKESNPLRLIAV